MLRPPVTLFEMEPFSREWLRLGGGCGGRCAEGVAVAAASGLSSPPSSRGTFWKPVAGTEGGGS